MESSRDASSSKGKIEIPRLLSDPTKHTVYPYVTGTSVLGIKYKDGVLLAADTLGAYGSTKRYKSVERLKAVGKHTVIGASGELSDFFYINTLLDELTTTDYTSDDGNILAPWDIHNYLNRVMYNRRNKFDPLWNSVVIGGVKDGRSYLGTVNMIGVHYSDSHLATGFGNHLARPIFRSEHREDMTEEEALRLLEKCLRVLFYRDRGSLNKVQVAIVTEAGVNISKPYALTSNWGYEFFVNPTKISEGGW